MDGKKRIAYDIVRKDKKYRLVEVEYDLDTNEGKVKEERSVWDTVERALFEMKKVFAHKLINPKE